MNQRLKAIILYLVNIRSLILYFALFNLILVWRWDASITFACVVCPWFHPWSYWNEPTILLVAALFLRLNRWWGNATAFALTGYLIGSFVYLLSRIDDPVAGLRGDWRLIRTDYPYIVGSWDSQYVFAVIIFCCSIFFLTRSILRRSALRRSADNSGIQRRPRSEFHLLTWSVTRGPADADVGRSGTGAFGEEADAKLSK